MQQRTASHQLFLRHIEFAAALVGSRGTPLATERQNNTKRSRRHAEDNVRCTQGSSHSSSYCLPCNVTEPASFFTSTRWKTASAGFASLSAQWDVSFMLRSAAFLRHNQAGSAMSIPRALVPSIAILFFSSGWFPLEAIQYERLLTMLGSLG